MQKESFFFFVRVNKVMLDCELLTKNSVLQLQWDVICIKGTRCGL